MNFVDLIKKSVLSEFSSNLSVTQIIVSLVIAFLIGIFIVLIYKKTYTGVVYSKSFSLCMILLSMVTALIINTINSNLALSLGMVGALSIVRFRTAVKEPVDTAFMFWAIAAGIMTGAGLYLIAIIGSLMLGLLFFVSYLFGFKSSSRYLLILKYDLSCKDEIAKQLHTLSKRKLKTKAISNGEVELTYEIDIKDNSKSNDKSQRELVDNFANIKGIKNISIISYQNDFGE